MRSVDIFGTLVYLPRPESWHPRAAALIEEARVRLPTELDDEEAALEIWATMGATTLAELKRRTKQSVELGNLIRDPEVEPGWPTIARCLVRLGSAPIPGCYLAAYTLLELVTTARRSGAHTAVLGPAAVAGWTDDGRRPLRDPIVARLGAGAGASSYGEQVLDDDLISHVHRFEKGMFGDG
ncbi:MAG: hypothetical protein H6719_37260 [Sandaracinaceae bacterium]|nr:hypothetical protein [Sandaracinaceae bacterium]